jgi:hypothetical protein
MHQNAWQSLGLGRQLASQPECSDTAHTHLPAFAAYAQHARQSCLLLGVRRESRDAQIGNLIGNFRRPFYSGKID